MMKLNQSTEEKFIRNVLLFASKRNMNKLDIIGLLETTKLIIYNTDLKEV